MKVLGMTGGILAFALLCGMVIGVALSFGSIPKPVEVPVQVITPVPTPEPVIITEHPTPAPTPEPVQTPADRRGDMGFGRLPIFLFGLLPIFLISAGIIAIILCAMPVMVP
jgi:hypothetical protein